MKINLIILMVFTLIGSACSSAQAALTNTPAPTVTNTFVPTATDTSVPTNTSTPSFTPTPVLNWDYVALGDSNPGGFGVSHSYVDIYADYIASDMGVGVRVHNWASNGATSTSLLSRLSSSSELQQDIRNAEIITIDIGANDWTPVLHMYPHKECGGSDNQDCLRELLQTYKQNLKAILQEIADLQGENAGTLILLVDLYMSNCDYPNIYRVGESEVFNGIKPYLDEFNAFISEAAQTHHAKVVPLYLTFNGPEGNQNPRTYLQGDQCHLNAKGHQKVVDMLRELGYEK